LPTSGNQLRNSDHVGVRGAFAQGSSNEKNNGLGFVLGSRGLSVKDRLTETLAGLETHISPDSLEMPEAK
jgi:hypothetical protein